MALRHFVSSSSFDNAMVDENEEEVERYNVGADALLASSSIAPHHFVSPSSLASLLIVNDAYASSTSSSSFNVDANVK